MKETQFYNLTFSVLAFLMAIYGMLYKTILKLPPVDYAFYVMIMALTVAYAVRRRRFMVPGQYGVLLLVVMALMAVNAIISKYTPGLLYTLIGSCITLMPFIMFMMAYNYRMSDDEIHRYMSVIVAITVFLGFILYLDTFMLHTVEADYQSALLSSGIVGFGAWASLANQAIVMCLAYLYRTGDRRVWAVIAFLAITIALTNQLKAIFGMVIIFAGYVFYLTSIKRSFKILTIVGAVAALGVALSLSATFLLKFDHYIESYGDSETSSLIARPALYIGAFQISSDYFPLGSGQGTYGSVPVNMVGSDVYSDYDLDKVWGLQDDAEPSFRMDAHWASVLGEMGWLGLAIYLMLFFYPARKVSASLREEGVRTRKYYVFVVRAGISVLFIDSFVLSLPKNFAFMIIYAGLAGLILNRKKQTENISNGRINNCDLQVSDALQDVQHLGQPDKTI